MRPLTLATKISLTVTVLVCGILAGAAFVSFSYFEREFKGVVMAQQRVMVSIVAEELDRKITLLREELDAAAAIVPPSALRDAEGAARFFSSTHYSRGLFENGVCLFSKKGVLLGGTGLDPEMIGADYSFREYFRRTVETGRPQISSPFLSSQRHGHPIVMFTAPVRGRGGEIAGFLGGSLDLLGNNFLGATASVKVGESGYLYLFHRNDGRFIVHRDPSRVMHADASAATPPLAAGSVGVVEGRDAAGIDSLLTLRGLETVPWVLGAAYPASEAFRPVDAARRIFRFALVPLLVLAALLVRVAVRRLTAQLHFFTGHVERLSADPSEVAEIDVKSGDEIGILASAFNRMIAERSERERRQLEQKDFFESLLRNTAVPLFVIDREHRVLIWNRACAELTGISEEEIVGTDRHWSAFYPSRRPCLADLVVDGRIQDIPELYETHSYSTLVEEGVRAERWYLSADGRDRYLFFDAAPIRNAGGERIAAIQTLQDITPRRQAEEKLRHYADELAAINGELRSFSYIVSHDLRAPLVNIRGFAGELNFAIDEIVALGSSLPQEKREQLERIAKGDVRESLGFIHSSVTRMDNLIAAILRFSRLGRRELRVEPVDTAPVVREILRSLSHSLEQADATVAVGALPEVITDRTAFEQVIGNLLDNAVKYLDPQRPGLIRVDAEAAAGETIFRVIDNGRGIAQEDLEKIFEIFRRAGKQDVPGEGMGLAYVKALLRRQGGRIWVESRAGEGSVFSFALPVHAPEQLEAA